MARAFPSAVIENLRPLIDGGRYPVKRIAGDDLVVEADVFKDGHDAVEAAPLGEDHAEAVESQHGGLGPRELGEGVGDWADPLIEGADEGMTTAAIRTLFAELRRELLPIVRAITEQPPADDRCLRQTFGEPAQLFVHVRQELLGCVRIPRFDGCQDSCDLAH